MNWILDKLNPYMLIVKIVGALIVALACWYAWHQFTGHYIDIGKAQMQPQIDTLKVEIDTLKVEKETLQHAYVQLGDAADQCSKSVQALAAASAKKKADAAHALDEAEKKAVGLQAQADWLSAQLAKPESKGKSCADALHEWRAMP